MPENLEKRSEENQDKKETREIPCMVCGYESMVRIRFSKLYCPRCEYIEELADGGD